MTEIPEQHKIPFDFYSSSLFNVLLLQKQCIFDQFLKAYFLQYIDTHNLLMSFCGTPCVTLFLIVHDLQIKVARNSFYPAYPSIFLDLGRSKGLCSQGKQFLASSRQQVSIATGQNITNIITTKLTRLTQFFIFKCNQLVNLC